LRQVALARSSGMPALLGSVRAILAILLVFVAVYIGTMLALGKTLTSLWDFSYPGVEQAYTRMGSDKALEEAHNDCKSRTDFVGRPSSSRRRLSSDFDGMFIVEEFTGTNALARAALYVSCLIQHKPTRFCQKVHRAHLAAALDDYYGVLNRIRGQQALMGAAAGVSPRQAQPVGKTDPRIVAGLRDLIEQGYLARRDISGFFGSLPGDLDLALHGAERKRAGCG
jgi:hypothetical protein